MVWHHGLWDDAIWAKTIVRHRTIPSRVQALMTTPGNASTGIPLPHSPGPSVTGDGLPKRSWSSISRRRDTGLLKSPSSNASRIAGHRVETWRLQADRFLVRPSKGNSRRRCCWPAAQKAAVSTRTAEAGKHSFRDNPLRLGCNPLMDEAKSARTTGNIRGWRSSRERSPPKRNHLTDPLCTSLSRWFRRGHRGFIGQGPRGHSRPARGVERGRGRAMLGVADRYISARSGLAAGLHKGPQRDRHHC
jgi:hypothetical protein